MLTSCLLKPHWGALGVPFMNSITGLEKTRGTCQPQKSLCNVLPVEAQNTTYAALTSFPSLSFNSSCDSWFDEYAGAVCGS